MLKNKILRAALAVLALTAATSGRAQPYSNAVMALNPAAYWPLTETTQPPNGYYVATNLGSLGSVAPGYYQTWYQPSGNTFFATNRIVHIPGPVGPGADQALLCGSTTGAGQYLIVPRITNGVANPASTIQAPFTIEAWVMTTNLTAGLRPIVTQGRNSVMGDANYGYANAFNGFGLGQFQGFFYFQLYCTNANANGGPELDMRGISANVWYHIAVTFDGTVETMYSNGVFVTSANATLNAAGLRYVPDPVNPLIIGSGNDLSAQTGGNEFSGAIAEVAIYPTVLSQSQIANHYNAGTGTSDAYATTVLTDSPSYYFRLNEPALTTYPSPGTYPVANNYGVLGSVANGAYQPGTTPGAAGPPYSGFGAGSRAVAINGFYGGVEIGGGALTPELNPTNHQPVSVSAWFRSNPADSRFQEIASHGDSSWRLAFNGNNASSSTAPWDAHFNPGAGPELGGANLADVLTNGFRVNDGNWHLAVGVSDGTTDSLYVDGTLFKTGAAVANITGSTVDAIIGGSPGHMTPSANTPNIRVFNGQIAHVAFFTNALTSAQVQQLYGAAGVAPSIVQQPPAALTVNAGQAVSIPVIAHGSATLSYQWYHTGGAAVAGQTTASLTFNPVALANAGSYDLVVSNPYGSVTSSNIVLSVNGPPIVQQQSPTTIHVFAGTAPLLRVLAVGPPPLAYQWSQNSSAISGATSSSYAPSTSSAGTSTYSCTVTNAYGTATINSISLTVLADPSAPYPVAILNDHPVDYFRLDEGPDNGSGNNGVTAYDYAGGLNAVYTNTLLGSPGYSSTTDPGETSAAFGQSINANSFAGNGSSFLSFAAPTGSNGQFSVELWFSASSSPQSDAGLVAIGYGYGGEQFALDCGGRASGNRTLRFYVNDANNATHTATCTNAFIFDAAWHHAVAICDEAGGHVLLYVDGILNNSTTVTAGAGLRSLTLPLSIGARAASIADQTYTNQFLGSIDDVSIYNYALSSNQVVSHYLKAGIAPSFLLAPPSTITTNEGANVIISATVLGTAPLSYQWQVNGVDMPGQTSSTLVLNNVSSSLSGNNYVLNVSNPYGSASTASSGGTTLIVNAGPPIISADIQPLLGTNFVGATFSYTVGVDGTAPFTYQWFRNGTAVSGATGSTYSFTTLSGTNTYYVHVTNAHGSADSSAATLVGMPTPNLNPSDYTYKMKITFSGYNRGETLADFPALVMFGTNLPGFAYSQFASPTGGDLRFTDANGTRELPSETDEWNPNGASTVWVQVPRLSTTNDAIWAYWGNPAATSPLAWSTNGGVWIPQIFEGLPSYEVVYHLKEGALPFADSTQLHPATNGVAPTASAGIVGTGGLFNGSSWLDAGTNDVGDLFTLSAWVNIDPAATSIQTIWANQHGGYGAPGFALFVNNYQATDQIIDLASGNGAGGGNESKSAPGSVTFGQWHLIEVAINRPASTANYYVDGSPIYSSTSIVNDFTTVNDLNLGRFIDGNFNLHGMMDEARIQQGTSSANWVWADYMTVKQNSAFESYGSIVSSLVTLTYQVTGKNLTLTWPQGTLLQAPTVTGPWTTNASTSPLTVPMTAAQQYYRVKVR